MSPPSDLSSFGIDESSRQSLMQGIMQNPGLAGALLGLANVTAASAEDARLIECDLLKERARFIYEEGKFDQARGLYIDAMKAVVGKSTPVPSEGYVSAEYMKLTAFQTVDVMGCCLAIARCLKATKNISAALEWLEEVEVVSRNMYFARKIVTFDWLDCDMDLQEFHEHRIHAYSLASDIFMDLQNTAAGARRCLQANACAQTAADVNKAALRSIIPAGRLRQLSQLRHPDPQLAPRLVVQDTKLQIRGSWEKLKVQKSGGIGSRYGCCAFIWNGHLYVMGGEKALDGPHWKDFWKLDLKKLDGWQPLAVYPKGDRSLPDLRDMTMTVHENKAYLFKGSPHVDVFDLITEKWGSIKTTIKGRTGRPAPWPYPNCYLCSYSAQFIGGTLFVFGGRHHDALIGCNLLIALNSKKREWYELSGTPLLKADDSCPGPRANACSWADEKEQRLYVMYGDADRMAVMGGSHGAPKAYFYNDVWSWGIKEKDWRREKPRGNMPCARSEMAYTFNTALNQMVTFGGFSSSVPTYFKDQGITLQFSYFADSFILDTSVSPPTWKQCLTRGFPTYRARASLISDPDTGKTYLFGGYTTSQFVPINKSDIARSFNDLWQLRTDTPGGFFEGVDVDEEARTAKAGPWQRCFACGCAGPWKKCGGSCAGKAFFCDNECLKDGWKDHKMRHSCSKK